MSRQCGSLQSKVLFRILKTKGSDIQHICNGLKGNMNNILKLSEDELCKFWYHIKRILLDAWKIYADKRIQVHSSTISIIRAVTALALRTISGRMFIPTVLLETVILLHSVILLKITDKQLKDEISYFLEKWWKLGMIWKERVIKNVVKYLVEACESSLKHVRRLYEIRSAINLLKSPQDIELILKLVNKKIVMSIKDGRALLCYLFTLGQQWIMGLHYNIKLMLENAPPNYISAYANLYATAWLEATKKNREIIDECFQDIIFHCLCASRNSKGRGKLGKHLLMFIKALHNNNEIAVKKMVIDQCTPLLWKHLKAPGSYIRCNAAEVLFTSYPVHDASRIVAERKKSDPILDKHYIAMTNLLKDSDREVCLIAVKGVCEILKVHWNNVPKDIMHEWLRILLHRTKTCSSSEIRKSVFTNLIQIVSNKESHSTMKEFLPKFSNSINDMDGNVVHAFITLLLYIQSNVDIQYWNIVPMSYILELLEDTESRLLRNHLTKLLWLRLFAKNSDTSETIREITHMGHNINALRKLICYSRDEIDWNITISFIENVLDVIECEGKHLSQFVGVETNVKRRKINNKNHDINNGPTHSSEFDDSDKLENIQTLLDVVSLLLLVRHGSSNWDSSIKDMDDRIISKIVKLLPQFLTYFKNTSVNDSVIFLVSLIPQDLIPDANMFAKELANQLNGTNISDDSILTILHVLFKWENIALVFDKMTKLFSESTNTVEICEEQDRRNEKLVFSLRILKHLLHVKFQSILIDKYQKNFIECADKLWDFKTFVNNKAPNCILHEDVVVEIFTQYITVISIIHKTDPTDAVKRFTNIMQWIEREIIPTVSPADETSTTDCNTKILKTIFTGANSMIAQFVVTPMLCCKIVLLYCKCFVSRPSAIFVNEAFETVLLLLNYGKMAYENEEHRVISVVIPKLLSAVMITISKYSEDDLMSYTNDLNALSMIVNKSFLIIDSTSKNYALHMSYMLIIFNTAITCISKDLKNILEDESTREVDFMSTKFPYLAEKIVKMILQTKKNQRLCIDILTKAMTKYTKIDRLAALLITRKILESSSKSLGKNVRNIALLARPCSEEETHSTAFDRVVNDATVKVIEKILD